MADKILMTLNGSNLLSNTWKQEIQIKEDGVYGETYVIGKREQMFLKYENIAQVNITRNILTSDMTIVNKGGSNDIVIKALNKAEAESAKSLIQQKIQQAINNKNVNTTNVSTADELLKFANLRDKGIITETEFQTKKKQILNI